MRLTVEITDQERLDALTIYIRDALGLPDYFNVVEFYPSLGQVVYESSDHKTQEAVKVGEQDADNKS